MDAKRIQQDIKTIIARHDEYKALQEKLIGGYRRFVVLALIVGFSAGALAGASYWYLYGYPPESATVDVLEVQEVKSVKVDRA